MRSAGTEVCQSISVDSRGAGLTSFSLGSGRLVRGRTFFEGWESRVLCIFLRVLVLSSRGRLL